MDAGDTVYFHPLLYHGSGTNKSKNYRKAISCHYGSSKCHYVDPGSKFENELSAEIVEYAKKRLGFDVLKYEDIWRFKIKLVSG